MCSWENHGKLLCVNCVWRLLPSYFFLAWEIFFDYGFYASAVKHKFEPAKLR